MTKKEFKEKIKRGLGSAILELRAASNIGIYRDIVLWAVLNDTCYDHYFEHSRGEYLFEALSYFNDNTFFEEAIIKKYNSKTNKTHDFAQLTEMLFYFAEKESAKAKETLYKKYSELCEIILNNKRLLLIKEKETIEQKMLENVCVWLTSLDGYNAFKQIVKDLTKYYLHNKGNEHFEWFWFFENSFDKFGKKRVLKYLRQKGIAYEPYDFKKRDEQEKTFSLQEIIDLCSKKLSWRERFDVNRFGRTATAEELAKSVEYIIAEPNLDVKANLLEIFKRTPFCSDINCIIEYSKTDHKKLKTISFRILEETVCDAVHNYAVELIADNKDISDAIKLLCKNFKKNDAELLSRAVKKLRLSYNAGVWYNAFFDVTRLIRKNKNAPFQLLEYLYENTLCSYCRENIVENIVKRKLPCVTRILEEGKYDSNDDIRTFAYKRIKCYNKPL